MEESVKTAIGEYLSTLNEDWENADKITVRISKIESFVLDFDGILDVENTEINGSTQNIALEADEIAALGTITDTAEVSE